MVDHNFYSAENIQMEAFKKTEQLEQYFSHYYGVLTR
jgi:hypothetical protein